MDNNNNEILVRIAKLLMLHGSFSKKLGLMNGKMGIIIFFYHYSKYTNKKIYEDFAGEMIDEIYKELHDHYPANFGKGLAGIAWGMEYLIQNQFVEAEANEVLEDLDEMIFEWDIRKISDPTLNSGLEGIAHYVISRCKGRPVENIKIPRDYIEDLIVSLENHTNSITTINILKNIMKGSTYNIKNTLLTDLITKIKYQPRNIFNDKRVLGIENNGYAGIGLNLIFKTI